MTSEIYFSRIIRAICDIDEEFNYAIEKEIDCFKNYEKTRKNCPTEYGVITIEKKECTKIYVSLQGEPCLTRESI